MGGVKKYATLSQEFKIYFLRYAKPKQLTIKCLRAEKVNAVGPRLRVIYDNELTQ